jgi:hypothetical protein
LQESPADAGLFLLCYDGTMTRICLIVALLFLPAAAMAQEDAVEQSEVPVYSMQPLVKDDVTPTVFAGVNYEDAADRAIDKRPPDFSFRFLRSMYMDSPQYEPEAADVNRQLINHAYTVQNSQDWIEIDENLAAFHTLIRDHLANIGAVEQALELSRQDERLGDPALYEWVREGLIRDLLKSGNGRTPHGSYDIITMEEQDYLVAQLGFEVLSRETSHTGIKYYNMLEVGDPETGEEFTIFVDATYPLARLEKEKQKPAFAVDILRQ